MSTNYYLRTAETPEGDEGIHLGKFAQGHAFMFRGYPEQGITDYGSWYALATSGQILTEAGRAISLDELVDTIDDARNMWQRFRVAMPRRLDQADDATGNRFTLVEFC